MKLKGKIYRAVTVLMVVTVLCCALYIMVKGLGLSDALDFGAGAYFYADIPSMEKFTGDGLYHTEIPYWVYVLLFLAWGWLMFRLWVRLESRGRKSVPPPEAPSRKTLSPKAPSPKAPSPKAPSPKTPSRKPSGERRRPLTSRRGRRG